MLVNSVQLDKLRKNPKNVIVLDASWHLPMDNRNAKAEFLEQHIIGAQFLDLDQFSDTETTLPNMLIHDARKLSEKISALGITNEHKIIFYDNSGLHSSCRAYWMFRMFGHPMQQLYILDGGFHAWSQYGGKIESGEARTAPAKSYTVSVQQAYVRTLSQMKSNIQVPKEQVVDLRHAVRYAGGKEHRPGLRSGHIPGSFCYPYMTMFEADGSFKSLDKIRKTLTGIGVELSYPIVSLCGSGVTASVLFFILDQLNHIDHAVYDGSWCEWSAEALYPGETNLSLRPVITSLDDKPC